MVVALAAPVWLYQAAALVLGGYAVYNVAEAHRQWQALPPSDPPLAEEAQPLRSGFGAGVWEQALQPSNSSPFQLDFARPQPPSATVTTAPPRATDLSRALAADAQQMVSGLQQSLAQAGFGDLAVSMVSRQNDPFTTNATLMSTLQSPDPSAFFKPYALGLTATGGQSGANIPVMVQGPLHRMQSFLAYNRDALAGSAFRAADFDGVHGEFDQDFQWARQAYNAALADKFTGDIQALSQDVTVMSVSGDPVNNAAMRNTNTRSQTQVVQVPFLVNLQTPDGPVPYPVTAQFSGSADSLNRTLATFQSQGRILGDVTQYLSDAGVQRPPASAIETHDYEDVFGTPPGVIATPADAAPGVTAVAQAPPRGEPVHSSLGSTGLEGISGTPLDLPAHTGQARDPALDELSIQVMTYSNLLKKFPPGTVGHNTRSMMAAAGLTPRQDLLQHDALHGVTGFEPTQEESEQKQAVFDAMFNIMLNNNGRYDERQLESELRRRSEFATLERPDLEQVKQECSDIMDQWLQANEGQVPSNFYEILKSKAPFVVP